MALFGISTLRASALSVRAAPPTRPLTGVLRTARLTAAASTKAKGLARKKEKRSAEFESLVDWLQAGGGFCSEAVCDAADPVMGRKLIASQNIKKGQTLVKFTNEQALDSNLAAAKVQEALQQSPDLQHRFDDEFPDRVPSSFKSLALLVAAERTKGADSEWWPILACMPADPPSLPLMWSEEDTQEVQHEPALEGLMEIREWVNDFTSAMAREEVTFDGVQISAEQLGWALSVVASKSFLEYMFGEGFLLLLPIIDACAHSAHDKINCSWKMSIKEDGSYTAAHELLAQENIAKGEKLTLANGGCGYWLGIGNSGLLLLSGFIRSGAPAGLLHFHTTSYELLQIACGLLGKPTPTVLPKWQDLALPMDWFRLRRKVEVHFSTIEGLKRKPVAAARILCSASQDDLQGRGWTELGTLKKPLAKDVEVKALLTLIMLCEKQLLGMGTSADEDRGLLAFYDKDEPKIPYEEILAIRFRLQIKEAIGEVKRQLFHRLCSL